MRFWVPNAITCASLVFAMVGIEQALRGRVVDGIWWALICVLTDRLDGAAAKALKAGTSFGVQLDSLADVVSFGVAPAALFYAWYAGHWPEAPLVVFCAMWVVAAAIRLARFNVAEKAPYYLGTPSTMTAGIVLTALLFALKYAGETRDGWRVLPIDTHALVPYMPFLLPLGAFGMVSKLKVPRLGRTRHRATTIILAVLAVVGFALGLMRRMPEYLVGGGLVWLGWSFAYHLRSRD